MIQEGHISGGSPGLDSDFPISLLSANDEELYATLLNGLKSSLEEIDISGYNISDSDTETIERIFRNVVDDNSSLFYVTGEYQIIYIPGEKIVSVEPVYNMGGAELIAAQAEYSDYIETITSLVNPTWTDLEIALFLHDYLALHYEYDTSLSIHDAYQFFKQKKGVCQAYTLAYQSLLAEFDIGRARALSESMNHIWNVIKIGGEWYHVDVTWDDPVPDKLGYVGHMFFLVSDAGIQKAGRDHFNWVSPATCTSYKYDDYSWIGTTAPFTYSGGQWYTLSSAGLAIYDPLLDVLCDDLLKLPYAWYVWNNPSSCYSGSFSGIGLYGGELYYNSPEKIYAYNPATNSTRIVFSPDCTNGYIYGIRTAGGRIDYLISKGPNPAEMENAEIRSYTIPRVMSGISIESLPNKAVYLLGEAAIDSDGLVVMLDYSNGDSEPIGGYAISGDLSGLGERTITVSYGGFSASFTVTVCGLSLVDKGDGSYQASFVLEAQAGGTLGLLSGYSASGRMKAVKTVPFEYNGGFISAQTTLTGIDEWSGLKFYLLDNLFNPKTIDRFLNIK
ncbi:hypothetical protein MASR2M70_05820 [Bacillota bacterium]